jgi:hypothetical protein
MPTLQKRKVVRAVKIGDGSATCACGEKIRLRPVAPMLKTSGASQFPEIVAVRCPKCRAEVRLDLDELSETSGVLRKGLRAPTDKKPAH